MYQKISDIKTEEDSMDVVDELLDRFGDIRKETENLIKIVEIRNKARSLGITRILATKSMIKFEPMNYKIALTNDFNNDIPIKQQPILDYFDDEYEDNEEGKEICLKRTGKARL